MRRARVIGLVAAVAAAAACGGQRSSPPPYALQVVGGAYDDGSGRLGLAVLTTLRDGTGAGPQTSWAGTLSDASGSLSAVQYDAPGMGSYSAVWWSAVAPAPGSYGLSLAPQGGSGIGASFTIVDGTPLAIPQVALSADATTLTWPPIAGAAVYECRISSGGALQQATLGSSPTCAVGDLPAGAYQATVLGYSVDLGALGAAAGQHPVLPARFDVSEARLAFSRSAAGAPAFRAVAAGGAFDYSGGMPGLAVWISIAQADGAAPIVPWSVEIVGPGLPSSAPLSLTYGANIPRLLFWTYDVPATPGVYSYTAISTAGELAGTFTVGTPGALGVPQGVSANGASQGAATVDWSTVAGARSYLAAAYDHTTGTLVASAWVPASPARFPPGTFISGSAYDIYVDATDADMVGGASPTQVSVSENTFQPAGFVAP